MTDPNGPDINDLAAASNDLTDEELDVVSGGAAGFDAATPVPNVGVVGPPRSSRRSPVLSPQPTDNASAGAVI